MAYALHQVLLGNTTVALTKSGLAGFSSSPFNYLLFSEWVCLGSDPRSVGVSNVVGFFGITVNQSSIQVQLNNGLTHTFLGTFTAPIGAIRSNVIVSADPTTQAIQVYMNRVPCAPATGGWVASGPFHIASTNWDIGAAGATSPGSGLGDLVVGAPGAFFDLSVTSNLDKIITKGLQPVDLGADASSIYGSAPQIYLTVYSGGAAPDFAINRGIGGSFTIVTPPLIFEAADACTIISPPPPPQSAIIGKRTGV